MSKKRQFGIGTDGCRLKKKSGTGVGMYIVLESIMAVTISEYGRNNGIGGGRGHGYGSGRSKGSASGNYNYNSRADPARGMIVPREAITEMQMLITHSRKEL